MGGGSQGGGSHAGASPGAGSHGPAVSNGGGRTPNHGTRPGSTNNYFPLRSGSRRHNGNGNGNGTFWVPYGVSYWDDDGYFWDQPSDSEQQPLEYAQQAPAPSPQVVVIDRQPRQSVPPPQSPKLVEVPESKEALAAAKPQPPTLFVMKGGEKFESSNYLLTAQSLQIESGNQRREIPLRALDLDATIAANHARGIDLTIPRDRSAVFVSF